MFLFDQPPSVELLPIYIVFCIAKNQNKLAFLTPKNLESEKKRKLLLEVPVHLRFELVFRKLKVRTAGNLL